MVRQTRLDRRDVAPQITDRESASQSAPELASEWELESVRQLQLKDSLSLPIRRVGAHLVTWTELALFRFDLSVTAAIACGRRMLPPGD